jgi:hypothetical protein
LVKVTGERLAKRESGVATPRVNGLDLSDRNAHHCKMLGVK